MRNLTKQNNINAYFTLPILDGVELLHAQNCVVDFPFHKHDTYNISLILKNTFHTKLHNKHLQAPAGTISITNSNEVHATPCESTFGNSFYTFYIPPDIINRYQDGGRVFFEDKIIYDNPLFEELYYLANNFSSNRDEIERRLANSLRSLVCSYADSKIMEISDRGIKKFIEEVVESDDFSLSQVASKYGINKYKFIRLFKQETGLTPNSFVLLKKIEKGKDLLRKGHPIFDVAIICGFYDTSHFYKYFKRYTGVTPSDFQASFLK